MSSHLEALFPETIMEFVEQDRLADFIEELSYFPDSDWRIGYRYYKELVRNGVVLDERWSILFRLLRKKDK